MKTRTASLLPARAQQLRAEIKRLIEKSAAPLLKQESPAAFVHRRMAELAAEKKKRTKSG